MMAKRMARKINNNTLTPLCVFHKLNKGNKRASITQARIFYVYFTKVLINKPLSSLSDSHGLLRCSIR